MTEPIVSISRIHRQATEAAARYTNVNDACPYPFGSEAGQLFKKMFLKALAEKQALAPANAAQVATKEIAS